MPDATVVTNGSKPRLRLERRLSAPPSEVWLALTDRDRLRSWFPCDIIVEGGEWLEGAALTFPFPPAVIDMTLRGVVREVLPPSILEFSWGDEILRFELYVDGDGTRLVLFDELPASYAARNAAGWEECLDRLVGQPSASTAWQSRFDSYVTEFEPLLGAQEGKPAGVKTE
jgi:uncharacterized protein YndB with AHSA1/START domain